MNHSWANFCQDLSISNKGGGSTVLDSNGPTGHTMCHTAYVWFVLVTEVTLLSENWNVRKYMEAF